MVNYKVVFYNDMGHLLIENEKSIPKHIKDFAYIKSMQYLDYAMDKLGIGNVFFILKPNLHKTWDYVCGRDIVTITFNVPTAIDPTYMKM